MDSPQRCQKINGLGTFLVKIGTNFRISRALVSVVVLILSGCGTIRRECPPGCVDIDSAPPEAFTLGDPSALQKLAQKLRVEQQPNTAVCKRLQILALSGGGKYGAFTAGVLTGWSQRGDRPVFDVVTGVSVGALLAVYAFVGQQADASLKYDFTEFDNNDIFRRRPVSMILLYNSVTSSDPLRQRIARLASDDMINAVARGYREGRRLYVGTTNLDTKKLSIWDMGAIAASDRPDRYDLFKLVLLASCSVPGQFPPIPIDITVNDKPYTELHVDGGVSSELFLSPSILPVHPSQLEQPRPLVGSQVHAIVAGKLYLDKACVRPRILGVLTSTIGTLIASMTQNDLIRIYTLALLTGMDYRFAALRGDFPDDNNPLSFDRKMMRALFEEGLKVGLTGEGWRWDPPGVRPEEQILPRKGVHFEVK